MVLDMLLDNWAWTLGIILFAIGLYVMGKVPRTKRIMGILFMINTHKGIPLMDRVANISPRFWTAVGHISLVLLFGTIGTAYTTQHLKKKYICALGSVFVFMLSLRLLHTPFGLLLAFITSLIAAMLYYSAANATTHKGAMISTIALSFGFFVGVYYAIFGLFVLPSFEVVGITKIVFSVATAIFGLPIIFLEFLLLNGLNIVTGATQQPGLNIGVPTIEGGQPGLKFLGTNLFLPLIPLLISLIVLIVLHEGFHGIQARAAKMKIRATGILTASFIPVGAFVDPDPKDFKKKPREKQMFVYAAGSFANIFVVAVIALVLTTAIEYSEPWEGVVFSSFMEGYSAEKVIPKGATITSVDSTSVTKSYDFTLALLGKRPGEIITIGTTEGAYSLELLDAMGSTTPSFVLREYISSDIVGNTLDSLGFMGSFVKLHTVDAVDFTEKAGKGYVGLRGAATKYNAPLIEEILEILSWVFILNLNVGIINLLPMRPLDGGFIYGEFGRWLRTIFVGDRHKKFVKYLSFALGATIFVIFALNFLPYFF